MAKGGRSGSCSSGASVTAGCYARWGFDRAWSGPTTSSLSRVRRTAHVRYAVAVRRAGSGSTGKEATQRLALQLTDGFAAVGDGAVNASRHVRGVLDLYLEGDLRPTTQVEPRLLGELAIERNEEVFACLDLAPGKHPSGLRVVRSAPFDEEHAVLLADERNDDRRGPSSRSCVSRDNHPVSGRGSTQVCTREV